MGIRLIDANKLQTTTTYFGISDTPVEVVKKSVIDNAKTVEAVPLSVIEDINYQLEELINKPCINQNMMAQNLAYRNVKKMIKKQLGEVKHDCTACKHSDEVDGSSCYECVKGMIDNFEVDEVKGDKE